jgi:hypothetical protein
MLLSIEILFGESHGWSKVIWRTLAGKKVETPVSMETSVRVFGDVCDRYGCMDAAIARPKT